MRGKYHGTEEAAGLDRQPRSRSYGGRFGRLFGDLAPAHHRRPHLETLGAAMTDDTEPPSRPEGGWGSTPRSENEGDNPEIPAGYTYLGQFIDHDITFDPASSLLRSHDPDALHNFRTPRFDLDSVYGEGPDDEPFMYEGDSGRLLLEERRDKRPDLPRSRPRAEDAQRRAIVGDPRNDENAIVSQLQVLLIQAHNKLVDQYDKRGREAFEYARTQLRWHYQWIVVNDFLRLLVGEEVVDDILNPTGASYLAPGGGGNLPATGFRFFRYRYLPFMPVEFAVAAYRFGHSMIRPRYAITQNEDKPIFGGESLGDDLRGFGSRQPSVSLDWKHFFQLEGADGIQAQGSRLIDRKLAKPLQELAFVTDSSGESRSLAVRNLQRGQALGLPSGQDAARRMGVKPLTKDELGIQELLPTEAGEAVAALEASTPLWYYVLREARMRSGGKMLGPVGGRIVAETLIGLLVGDRNSYLTEPGWNPKDAGVMAQAGEELEMADLVRFVEGG